MALPNLPIVAQANWSGTNTWPMWDQANANILTDCLQDVQYTRSLANPTITEETCELLCTDEDWLLVQGAALQRDGSANPLYPYVAPGVRVRVLEQTALGSGVWIPHFFGYISEIRPTPDDAHPPTVTVRLESPLKRLANRSVTLPALDPADAGVHALGALEVLMSSAGLVSPFVDISSPTLTGVPLPRLWGGGRARFGQTLTELLTLLSAVAMVEPRYATVSGAPDWVLTVWRPEGAATLTWDATDGDIEGGSSVTWGEVAVA